MSWKCRMTERDNHMTIGFNRTTPPEFAAAAETAYALNPLIVNGAALPFYVRGVTSTLRREIAERGS